VSQVSSVLQNRYYVGTVTFSGVEYPGKHQALVSEALYDRVQEVRTGRITSGQKPRIHTHYLKGSVFCGQCSEPLSYEVSRGRMGTQYEYFYCVGRRRYENGCTFRATQSHLVEALVEDHWETVRLSD